MNYSYKMKVKENSFRCLQDPFDNSGSKKYVFYVLIDNVAKGIPMATNPREQNVKTSVAKAIQESLESNDGFFHLKNRGIVLSAKDVIFDNIKNEIIIIFDDDSVHGDVDGGHTYKIVCEHIGDSLNQYVQFEVMTGVESIIEQLAEARNTSVQVDAKSMAELANNFEPIKEAIGGMPFFNRIAFKQNQVTKDEETGKNLKMIDAREVVAVINMFNIEKFSEIKHPTQAYSSKAKMLEIYLNDKESYRKFIDIAPEIFQLYDAIETEFADAYNSDGGKYGRKKYSGYKNGTTIGKSKYLQNNLQYKIPDGLIYPTIAAFRCLVEYNIITNRYGWKNNVDPIKIWNDAKIELTKKIMNYASDFRDNPNSVGKNPIPWDLAYMTVQRFLDKSKG